MIWTPEGFLNFSVNAVLGMLSLSLLLGFVRLVKGPSLPDRVVALDLIGVVSVGFIAVFSIAENEPVLLLPAIVLALIMFLGTVAYAFYVDKGGQL